MDRLNDLEFEDMFDYNFSVNEEHIRTMEDLHVQLIAPLEAGHRMFYRGESVDSLKRPLLPTLTVCGIVFRVKGKIFIK